MGSLNETSYRSTLFGQYIDLEYDLAVEDLNLPFKKKSNLRIFCFHTLES